MTGKQGHIPRARRTSVIFVVSKRSYIIHERIREGWLCLRGSNRSHSSSFSTKIRSRSPIFGRAVEIEDTTGVTPVRLLCLKRYLKAVGNQVLARR